MQIIREHKTNGDTAYLFEPTPKIFGPFEDADAFLRQMGCRTDLWCSAAAEQFDRHGDWEFGEAPAAGKSGFGGPYILLPEGWNEDGDNDGLHMRIFSVVNILDPNGLK